MKISEIFESIQGEGRYAGYPALFIRLSGCNLKCSYCDTKYHTEGKEMTVEQVIKRIKKYKGDIVIWTGGEPMLQSYEIQKVMKEIKDKQHHLESNGMVGEGYYLFDYLCISPKNKATAKEWYYRLNDNTCPEMDVKVVTDLNKVGKDMIKYATILMPLTVNDIGTIYGIPVIPSEINRDGEIVKRNELIRQNVWDYCIKHNLRYSPRLHYEIWGSKRGI